MQRVIDHTEPGAPECVCCGALMTIAVYADAGARVMERDLAQPGDTVRITRARCAEHVGMTVPVVGRNERGVIVTLPPSVPQLSDEHEYWEFADANIEVVTHGA
jgi:hypothetical protein